MGSELFSIGSLFKMVTSLANSFLQKKYLMVWLNNVPIFREPSCADPEWEGGAGVPEPPPPTPRKITKL